MTHLANDMEEDLAYVLKMHYEATEVVARTPEATEDLVKALQAAELSRDAFLAKWKPIVSQPGLRDQLLSDRVVNAAGCVMAMQGKVVELPLIKQALRVAFDLAIKGDALPPATTETPSHGQPCNAWWGIGTDVYHCLGEMWHPGDHRYSKEPR